MPRTYRADLHVHTCLSPCADLEMSPQKIVKQAKIKELDILGICDHNSAENTPALKKAAERLDIQVFPGLEVTSKEEVHVLALFNELEPALLLQDIVYANLPGENDEKMFGMQVIVNHRGDVLGFNKKLLIGASTLTLEEVVAAVHSLGGLAVASHIDREAFSVIGQLGFIPDHLEFDALEISSRITYREAREKFRTRHPLISASDAHFLNEIGASTTMFLLESGTLDEIKLAFLNVEGRKICN